MDGFLNEYLFVLPDEWAATAGVDELFSGLLVTDIGYFPRAHHHYRERTCGCDTAILLYCRDGMGSVRIGDEPAWALSQGQAVLIPPDTPHGYGASQQQPWSVYWVHLKGEALPAYLRLIDERPMGIPPQFDGDIVREFSRCFELLKVPYQREEYLLVCQSVGSILALLACAAKQHRNQLTQKGEKAIERCIWFMKANLSQPLSLDQLAAASGFSASHLNALFQQATGHAPVDYFLRMKMQAASKELYFTARSVKDIAIEYGIKDPYYFSRIFKKVMGASPSAYREQARG